MSNEALSWAFKQDMTNSSAKFVLVVLADFADENGECFPGQARIATMTAMSERSVRRGLDWLAEHGYISRQHRYLHGNRTSDRYRLQLSSTQPNPATTDTQSDDYRNKCPVETPPASTTGQNVRPARPAETTTGQIDRRSDCPALPDRLAGELPDTVSGEPPVVNPQRNHQSSSSTSISAPTVTQHSVEEGETVDLTHLSEAMSAQGMRVAWNLRSPERVELAQLAHRHGIAALVEHAVRAWHASSSPPHSVRYFLPGWRGLAPPAESTSRAVQPATVTSEPASGPPAPARASTTDQRVQAGLTLAAKYAAQEGVS